jgi:hypothetical protein
MPSPASVDMLNWQGGQPVWHARAMRHALLTAACGVCTLLLGCGGHGPRTVSNPDLEEKIPAIQDASRRHDLSVAPQLVKDLESDDPAVRFYSIRGLHALTGETFGYRYYDSEDDRKAAVDRWRQWLAEQQRK